MSSQDDLIARAEAALSPLIRDLAAGLKAAQAEVERLQPRTITTTDELKALQPSPELLSATLIKCHGVPAFGGIYELNDDGTWNDFDAMDSTYSRVAPEDVPLPAVVIWEPK